MEPVVPIFDPELRSTVPKLLEETVVEFEIADLLRRRPLKRPATVPARAAGVHVSGVLRYCATAAGILKPGDELEELLPLRMAIGIAVEEFIASMYPEWRWQPGEVVMDGIAMNSDGIGSRRVIRTTLKPTIKTIIKESLIEECKATWKSSNSRRGPAFLSEWMWMQQGAAYCHGYGPRLVRWHVVYMNGDYRASGPQYIRYLVQFSDEEIRQSWAMIMANKDKAVAE